MDPPSNSKSLGGLLAVLGLAVAVVLGLILKSILMDAPEPRDSPAPFRSQGNPPETGESSSAEDVIFPEDRPRVQAAVSGAGRDLMAVQLNNEGIDHYTRGDFSEAASLFRRAMQREPGNTALGKNLAAAVGSLAWKQIEARQYPDALLNFREALGLSPEESTLWLGLGLAHHRLNEADRAIESLKKSIALRPEAPSPYAIIGDIYYQIDDINMAIGYYEKGIELDPDNRRLKDQLAKARREQTVQSGFQQEASRNFTVKFEGREEKEAARRVLDGLDEAYRTVGRGLSHYPSKPITVILYTGQQFRDVTRTPEWTSGLFDGKIRIPIGGDPNPDLLRKVLMHEYTHAVVFDITGSQPLPRWVDEGIAEYFENRDGPDPSDALRTLIRAGGQRIPLSSLHGSFMGFSGDRAGMAYLESHAAVNELVNRYGLDRFRRLLDETADRKDFEGAFSNAFMVSYDSFLSNWNRIWAEAKP